MKRIPEPPVNPPEGAFTCSRRWCDEAMTHDEYVDQDGLCSACCDGYYHCEACDDHFPWDEACHCVPENLDWWRDSRNVADLIEFMDKPGVNMAPVDDVIPWISYLLRKPWKRAPEFRLLERWREAGRVA